MREPAPSLQPALQTGHQGGPWCRLGLPARTTVPLIPPTCRARLLDGDILVPLCDGCAASIVTLIANNAAVEGLDWSS
jgi:hypothetical protein